MKKLLKFLFSRIVLVGLSLVIQTIVLLLMILKFDQYFSLFYGICIFLSIVVVLLIVDGKSNPGYKIAWIIPILVFPIFGGLFYLLFGGNKLARRMRRRIENIREKMDDALGEEWDVLEEIDGLDESAANQSRYILNYAGCPPYRNTATEYLPSGEVKFERLVEELKKAKHYIFLEYFIIEEGKMWNTILDILKEKADQGVEVRVIYDDMGCLMTLPHNYHEKLEAMGIRCAVFNPFVPVLTPRLNNRDHRKIAVIDGHTGFTGGINLADEYINAYEKYGHWHDAAIMIKGDAVWSLTVMFLSMWDNIHSIDEDYEWYRPHVHQTEVIESDGYVQPFSDNPLDGEAVGETVYLNLINKAKRYVYINTPYLIVDNEMVTALTSAAKAGIDVRITTPHIPDKKTVFKVTRAYYEPLLEAGVKIYEYTPGFVHAKTFVVDDEYGAVGTINLDYRSLYLHFECSCWLFRTKSIHSIKENYLKTLTVCQEMTRADCRTVKGIINRLCRAVLRVFAPLM